MSDISVEKYERFRIDHGTFSSLYYPQLDIMNVEFQKLIAMLDKEEIMNYKKGVKEV